MRIHYFITFLFTINIISCGAIKKRPNRRMLDENVAKNQTDDEFDQFRRTPASVSRDELKRKRRAALEGGYSDSKSLWTGKGTDSYLFTNQTEKQLGDIILVNVLDKLRKEISTELKLSQVYDRWERTEKGTTDKKEGEPKEEAKEKPNEAKDHISTIVEEEINQTHLLIKGRKTVLYKKQKKLIEFKGLVARKDITESDTINSDQILESTVKVLR